MEKPNNISDLDFSILKKLYPNNMDDIIKKLNANYPVQYLIGNVNFYGYQINVDERVLIPRFETEWLVDKTIKLIKELDLKPKIIDICTGSGAIAIALSKELDCEVTALDISKPAIDLAIENTILNNANVKYLIKDIKNCDIEGKYNVIISNPPYLKKEDKVAPQTKYEPQISLYANDNGLEFYKIIIDKSRSILEDRFLIAFEIGDLEGDDIINYAKTVYPNANIFCQKDLNNYERYLFIVND